MISIRHGCQCLGRDCGRSGVAAIDTNFQHKLSLCPPRELFPDKPSAPEDIHKEIAVSRPYTRLLAECIMHLLDSFYPLIPILCRDYSSTFQRQGLLLLVGRSENARPGGGLADQQKLLQTTLHGPSFLGDFGREWVHQEPHRSKYVSFFA